MNAELSFKFDSGGNLFSFSHWLEAGRLFRGVLFLCWTLLIWHPAGAEAAASCRERAVSRLEQRVDSILVAYGQDPGNWGILVRSLASGDDVVCHNADRLFMPASSLKLLVTAAALDLLGADFRYTTSVMATGRISGADSLLRGDLVLRGSGDPTISARFYPDVETVWEKLAGQVYETGIRRVSGSLVADNTLFVPPRRADGWSQEDLLWWFTAQVSALSYNDNCVDLQVFPGLSAGLKPEVRVKPEGARFHLLNRATTVARRSENRLVIGRDSPDGPVCIGGGIHYRSPGFLEYVSVDSPARFAAGAFLDALARRGIRIDGPLRVLEAPIDSARYLELEKKLLVVAQHTSVPLSEIVKVINKNSHNFYAEQLLFTLGARRGREGSFTGGLEVEQGFLRGLGLDTRTLRLEDGSGLSRLNLVTPEMFVRILAFMDKHRLREIFLSSLPVGGKDRGVRNMRRTAAQDRVFAKTGYISAVLSLSGYNSTADGEPVAFSILGNNWLISRKRAHRLIRDVCVAVSGFSSESSPETAGDLNQ